MDHVCSNCTWEAISGQGVKASFHEITAGCLKKFFDLLFRKVFFQAGILVGLHIMYTRDVRSRITNDTHSSPLNDVPDLVKLNSAKTQTTRPRPTPQAPQPHLHTRRASPMAVELCPSA